MAYAYGGSLLFRDKVNISSEEKYYDKFSETLAKCVITNFTTDERLSDILPSLVRVSSVGAKSGIADLDGNGDLNWRTVDTTSYVRTGDKTFTLGSDVTSLLKKGRKLRFNQSSSLVCSVLTAVYASFKTLVTVEFSDYTSVIPMTLSKFEVSRDSTYDQALLDIMDSDNYQNLGSKSGSVTIDFTKGQAVSLTVSGDLSIGVTSLLKSKKQLNFIVLTNGGNYNLTFDSNITWIGGSVPEFSVSGTDIVMLLSVTGGTAFWGCVWNSSRVSPYVKSTMAPSNTSKLWVDTSTNTLKYYNGASWIGILGVYGG
jgi:hypothetical protein